LTERRIVLCITNARLEQSWLLGIAFELDLSKLLKKVINVKMLTTPISNDIQIQCL